ncbi:hypothetical protein GCM10023310_00850 [Paenibacillus vulneris]|uniref:Uncharacterized protein n=1 Tax=Paenibacillus vulneris TaxID=1133364 RepID=A0ABW3UZZ2_9BACL
MTQKKNDEISKNDNPKVETPEEETPEEETPEEETTKQVELIENIKYRGKYYASGTVLDIQPNDYESLMKDGVIRTESDDDDE